MADEKDLEKAKAAAAAKAKAAAAAKAKAAAQVKAADASDTPASEATPAEVQTPVETPAEPAVEAPIAEGDDLAAAKAKAVAAAKAKAAAAAAAKAKAAGVDVPTTESGDNADDAKAKAIAAAKAKAAAAAAAKAKAAGGDATADADVSDDPKAAAIAAAKAKAAAVAAAKAKAAGGVAAADTAPAEEEKPSKNRPTLDLIVKKITDKVGAGAIEESYINFLAKELPTLVIKKEQLLDVVELLYNDEELDFKYLSNLHGTDYETHMEVFYYLQSYSRRHMVAIRVKTDRDGGKLPSVTSLWYGSNWQEREVYDLLGIEFEGHPNMVRMFLPESWVGHPLRKDYVQFDEEV